MRANIYFVILFLLNTSLAGVTTDRSNAMVLVLFVLSKALWQLAAGVFMFSPVCCLCLAFDHYFWEEGAGWFHWLVKCVLILLTAHCKISYIHYAENAIAGSLEADF